MLAEVQAKNLESIKSDAKGAIAVTVVVVAAAALIFYFWLVLPHVAAFLAGHGINGWIPIFAWAALFGVPAFYLGQAIRDVQVKSGIEKSKCPECGIELSEQLTGHDEEIVATTPKSITKRDSQGKVTEEHWTDVRYKFHTTYRRACCGAVYHQDGVVTRKEDVQRHRR